MKNPTIISLGGSLVVPDGIDADFVRDFRALILARATNGEPFIIIVGGGKTARRYQAGASEIGIQEQDELDWIGIYATRLNAMLLRSAFGDKAHGDIITDPCVLPHVEKPIAIGAGWKPGWSTDFDSVEMAVTVNSKRVVNLSNINYVYTKDPKKFPDAEKIEKITWEAFRKILPEKWSPGVNTPFDPIAAKRAQELQLEVAIMSGKPLENLKNYLDGKTFVGTVVK